MKVPCRLSSSNQFIRFKGEELLMSWHDFRSRVVARERGCYTQGSHLGQKRVPSSIKLMHTSSLQLFHFHSD